MRKRERADVVRKVFGNEQVLNSFLTSREVSVQRLHLRSQGNVNPAVLANYDHDPAVSVAPLHYQSLQQLLQRHSSYEWRSDFVKSCIVDYGMVFTFRSDVRPVRVALCFNCNWLGVFDGADRTTTHINAEMDFDPIRSDLVAIVKTIYPSDSEIQGLK